MYESVEVSAGPISISNYDQVRSVLACAGRDFAAGENDYAVTLTSCLDIVNPFARVVIRQRYDFDALSL
jgi:hypothetical protein